MEKYNHKEIEIKWQKRWADEKLYQVDLDKVKKPYYNLMMFPYPSAEGLHVGNMYAFVHADAYGRYMRLKGYDVFEPIGLDGFGIHSENYAIKIKEHIRDVSARTEKHFYDQLHQIGNAYDWTRTVETYKANYYKWTQWLFLKMYEKGLAYRKKSSVNWCPSCKTVLSDEQVISGKCERCSAETEKKAMEQWFWRITDYAERLLKNLETMDWSEEVKTIQKNWIGKSEGARVKFRITSDELRINEEVEVFTTRPDTLFGATYFVLSPEHPLIENLSSAASPYAEASGDEKAADDKELRIKNLEEVKKYIEEARKKSEIDRTDLAKEKTGVELKGIKVINPVNNEEIPVWIADYVLMGYGTGAIMAVPAHDERDWEFAKKYDLPIREVVEEILKVKEDEAITPGLPLRGNDKEEVFTGEGVNVNSGFLNGLKTKNAINKINKWLEEKDLGKAEVNYKLRDWCISRQRYWGPPIPMVYCENCAKSLKGGLSAEASAEAGWVPVPEEDLPVELPEMDDFLPDGTGKGPLNKIKDFVNTTCPKCGGPAMRETDVSDPFVDSSWYFMRYLCTDFNDKALDKGRLKKWMPVNMYIGGKEHSVLHLLYSRFVTMVMHELGYVPEPEPYRQFRAHGLLIRDGAKISKSKGNIINPDEYIEKFGADAVRLYLMFLGDMRQGGDWRDSGMAGMYRFIKRIWSLLEMVGDERRNPKSQAPNSKQIPSTKSQIKNLEVERLLHKTIKSVGEDLENLKYNTAIAKLMILVNKIQEEGCTREQLAAFAILLSPFAPHLAEELWSRTSPPTSLIGKEKVDKSVAVEESVFKQKWPEYDKELVKDEMINLVVQVNGKLRHTITVSADITEEEAKEAALGDAKIKKWTKDKEIVKVIFVKGKLVNIVVR